MFRGNPHQDHPFSGGFQQGWGDRRSNIKAILEWQTRPPYQGDASKYPYTPPWGTEDWNRAMEGPLAAKERFNRRVAEIQKMTPAEGVEAGRRAAEEGRRASQQVENDLRKHFGIEKFPYPTGNPHQAGQNRKAQFESRTGRYQIKDPTTGSNTMIPLASYGYSTDDFYNPWDDQYYNDYEDDYIDNPMRDDFYLQDPFSDIWGNQGGPLFFG